MISIDCEQGSAEWWSHRAGIPTASCFDKIVTPTGKPTNSQGRRDYLGQLAAEWIMGGPEEDEFVGSKWVERGKAMEPKAFTRYAATRGVRVDKVGFCYRDEDRMVGCSPDGLIGEDGGLELKCPMAGTHLRYVALDQVPSTYVRQVQGSLWITGRDYWDFASFHPDIDGMSLFVVRSYPDPAWMDALDAAIPPFIEEVKALRESLLEKGVRPMNGVEVEPTTDYYAGVPF